MSLLIAASTSLLAQKIIPAPLKTSAEDIITATRANYSNYRALSARFTSVNERRVEREGLLFDLKSEYVASIVGEGYDRSWIEVRNYENKVLRVTDGRLQWYYLPDYKIYTLREANERGSHQPPATEESLYTSMIDAAQNALRQYAFLGDSRFNRQLQKSITLLREEDLAVGSNNHPCYLLEVNLSSGAGFESIQHLWIEKQSRVIWREVLTVITRGSNGVTTRNITTINFSEIVINQPTDPSIFFFARPTEARLVEKLNPFIRPAARPAALGAIPAEFALNNLEGQSISLRSLRGKVVLINFWATWCGPCRVEMPHLEKLYQQYKTKDVVFLPISNEDPETVRKFLSQSGYTFGSLIDPDGRIQESYGVRGIPHTFLIDKSGMIVESLPGARSEEVFRTTIERALKAESRSPVTAVAGKEGMLLVVRNTEDCMPQLLNPQPGGRLRLTSGPNTVAWMFKWTGCDNDSRYHFQIIAPGSATPYFDYSGLLTLSYAFPNPGSIAERSSLKGWTWRIRPQRRGKWGKWVEGKFDIERW